MTVSLTECPICAESICGWQGEPLNNGLVFNCGATAAEVRSNGSLPVLASWRCSNKHEFVTVIVVSKIQEMIEDERREW